MKNQIKLSDLIVALPAFHIVVTTLFIAGYYFAFDSRLALLATPADLFSVSVKDIGSVYLFALVLPTIAGLTFRATTGAWTYAESVRKAADEREREAVRQRWESSRKFYRLNVAAFFFVFTTIAAIDAYRRDYLSYSWLLMYVLFAFAFLNIWFANKIETSAFFSQVTYTIGAILLFALFSGLGSGQRDRHLIYTDALKDVKVSCGPFRILRPIGNHFLAIGPTGHVVVDADCRPKFRVSA